MTNDEWTFKSAESSSLRSADWQSAVSPTGSRPGADKPNPLYFFRASRLLPQRFQKAIRHSKFVIPLPPVMG
jgi:hypothetical protein